MNMICTERRYGPNPGVPVVPYRNCGIPRLDDGTRHGVEGCGAYQNVRVQPEKMRHSDVLMGEDVHE